MLCCRIIISLKSRYELVVLITGLVHFLTQHIHSAREVIGKEINDQSRNQHGERKDHHTDTLNITDTSIAFVVDRRDVQSGPRLIGMKRGNTDKALLPVHLLPAKILIIRLLVVDYKRQVFSVHLSVRTVENTAILPLHLRPEYRGLAFRFLIPVLFADLRRDPVQLLVIFYIRIVCVNLNFLDLRIIVLLAVQHIDRVDRLIVPLPLSVSSGQYSLHVIVEGDLLRDIINLGRDLIQDIPYPQIVRLQKIAVIVHQNLVGISDEKGTDQQDGHHDRHKVNHIQLLPDARPAQKAVSPAPWFSFVFLFMNFSPRFVGIIHRYCTVCPL